MHRVTKEYQCLKIHGMKRKLYSIVGHFGGVHVAHLFKFSGFFYLGLFTFVLCLVCTMLPTSLNCQFVIAPLVF